MQINAVLPFYKVATVYHLFGPNCYEPLDGSKSFPKAQRDLDNWNYLEREFPVRIKFYRGPQNFM